MVQDLVEDHVAGGEVANDLVDLDNNPTLSKLGNAACLDMRIDHLPLVRPVRTDGIPPSETSTAAHIWPVDVRRHIGKQGLDVAGVEADVEPAEEVLEVHEPSVTRRPPRRRRRCSRHRAAVLCDQSLSSNNRSESPSARVCIHNDVGIAQGAARRRTALNRSSASVERNPIADGNDRGRLNRLIDAVAARLAPSGDEGAVSELAHGTAARKIWSGHQADLRLEPRPPATRQPRLRHRTPLGLLDPAA